MSRRIVKTETAPAAIGPYSQAVLADGWLFTAGQVPIDPATAEIVGGDIRRQTQQVMENLRGVLAASGCGFGDVVKSTVYVTDLTQFGKLNEVYATYFVDLDPPARSTVQVAALPLGALVEIDMVARVPSG